MTLIERIRRAREIKVPAGGFNFTVRRPTDLEMLDFNSGGKVKQGDILERFVTDWDLKEVDIVPGGTGISVPFDSALFMEWVSDHPDTWSPITEAVMEGYKRHRESLAESLGNFPPGSKG